MSENENVKVIETAEVKETNEKKFFADVKTFFKHHGKKLAIAGGVTVAVLGGTYILAKKFDIDLPMIDAEAIDDAMEALEEAE